MKLTLNTILLVAFLSLSFTACESKKVKQDILTENPNSGTEEKTPNLSPNVLAQLKAINEYSKTPTETVNCEKSVWDWAGDTDIYDYFSGKDVKDDTGNQVDLTREENYRVNDYSGWTINNVSIEEDKNFARECGFDKKKFDGEIQGPSITKLSNLIERAGFDRATYNPFKPCYVEYTRTMENDLNRVEYIFSEDCADSNPENTIEFIPRFKLFENTNSDVFHGYSMLSIYNKRLLFLIDIIQDPDSFDFDITLKSQAFFEYYFSESHLTLNLVLPNEAAPNSPIVFKAKVLMEQFITFLFNNEPIPIYITSNTQIGYIKVNNNALFEVYDTQNQLF